MVNATGDWSFIEHESASPEKRQNALAAALSLSSGSSAESVAGQQPGGAFCGVISDASEHVGEPGAWIQEDGSEVPGERQYGSRPIRPQGT
jgi:hypothetical protein